jgi:hypothetical protein
MIYIIAIGAVLAIAYAWWRANRELRRIQELLERDTW